MNNCFKQIGKVAFGMGTGLLVGAQSALAASIVDVAGITVDTTALGTLGAVIVTALASIWGFRKIVKSVNRS